MAVAELTLMLQVDVDNGDGKCNSVSEETWLEICVRGLDIEPLPATQDANADAIAAAAHVAALAAATETSGTAWVMRRSTSNTVLSDAKAIDLLEPDLEHANCASRQHVNKVGADAKTKDCAHRTDEQARCKAQAKRDEDEAKHEADMEAKAA